MRHKHVDHSDTVTSTYWNVKCYEGFPSCWDVSVELPGKRTIIFKSNCEEVFRQYSLLYVGEKDVCRVLGHIRNLLDSCQWGGK